MEFSFARNILQEAAGDPSEMLWTDVLVTVIFYKSFIDFFVLLQPCLKGRWSKFLHTSASYPQSYPISLLQFSIVVFIWTQEMSSILIKNTSECVCGEFLEMIDM